MTAENQNATIYAGDDAIFVIPVTDENGNPLSLAGASLTWTIAKSAGSVALATKTIGNGITVTDEAGGKLQVVLTHQDTAPLQGKVWQQLVMQDASGNVSTLTTGTITVMCRS